MFFGKKRNEKNIPQDQSAQIKDKQKAVCKKYGFDYMESETMKPETLEWVLRNERQWINEQKKKRISEAQHIYSDMDGIEFESICADILELNGYACKLTKGSGDHGADIIANKDGKTYAIQCKRYDSSVGNKAVQEAYTGKAFYNTDYAVVLTNSDFTKQAIEDANKIGVLLWDGDMFSELVSVARDNS